MPAYAHQKADRPFKTMFFRDETLDDALHSLISAVLEHGVAVSSTKGENIEITGVSVEIDNPRARLSRTETRGKPFSCLGELMWYLAGSDKLDFIEYYIPMYQDFVEDDGTIHGGYGPRIFPVEGNNQFDSVLALLKRKPETRQAVIQIFSGNDIVAQKKDTPCTCTLQFLLRDQCLHLIACMRSNDAYLGFPHDVFSFTMLQEIMAAELGVNIGKYQHFAGSMHIYESQLDEARQFIREGFQATLNPMPPMPPEKTKPALTSLLSVEKLLRTQKNAKLSSSEIESLPEYWQDIARLLFVYRCHRNQDLDGLVETRKEFRSDVYDLFVERKIEELRNKQMKKKTTSIALEDGGSDA